LRVLYFSLQQDMAAVETLRDDPNGMPPKGTERVQVAQVSRVNGDPDVFEALAHNVIFRFLS
jgi:hypothetical protein